MIAEPAENATPEPPKGGRRFEWIGLEEASRRSGLSEGHLRRLCGSRWMAEGLARLIRRDGQRPHWQIREDADAALLGVVFPERVPFDHRKLTEKQRKLVAKRLRILRAWWAWRRSKISGATVAEITDKFIDWMQDGIGEPICRSTLYNWERGWRARGRAGLVDGRWKTEAEPKDDAPFLYELKRLYLDQRKRSKRFCYDLAVEKANEEHWDIPAYRTACRLLEAIPLATVKLHRGGEEKYVNAAPFIQRDYTTIDSNGCWIGDHHQFDVRVCDGDGTTRPWLTAWMDARSRMIVGWRIFTHAPNQDTILAAFRSGCEAHGVPKGVYIDNGKDFDAEALQGQTKKQRFRRRGKEPLVDEGIFGELGVDVDHAQPYRPQSKTIERFFGTVAGRFSRLFESYCGNSPDTRPEDLPRKIERGRAPTLAEFTEDFAAWLEADYHHKPHGGDGMDGRSPAAVFAACLKVKRTLDAELLDVLLLKKTRLLNVGRNGVTWQGISYGRNEDALFRLRGKEQVYLRVDDRDLSRVQVYSSAGRLLCVAHANEKLPFKADSQLLRQAIAENRRDRRAAKAAFEARPRIYDSLPDRMHRKAAEQRSKDAPSPTDPPPTVLPIRHPLEDQLPALRRELECQQQRKAVGAESLSFLDITEVMREELKADEEARQTGRFRYERPADADAAAGSESTRFIYPAAETTEDAFKMLGDALKRQRTEDHDQPERQDHD